MMWIGLILLLAVVLGLAATGLPAFVVLLAVSVAGVCIGAITGGLELTLLSALPGRLVNLLENDLIQALPLYVLMGALLDRLGIADSVFRVGLAAAPRSQAAPVLAGLGLGALFGPMNGSVGANVMMLSRAVAPRLAAEGVPAAERHAAVIVASTLGVVVPPSLVLIFLGDAMLSAHTIAVTATGSADRVINTQDVFRGALVPAGLFLAAILFVAWRRNRRVVHETSQQRARPRVRDFAVGATAIGFLIVMLAGVATGNFYAVEAAAMGAFALLVVGVVLRLLTRAQWAAMLQDVLATTGALFALLVAATTLTLILRMFGTDLLVGGWIAQLPGGALGATALVLGVIALSAFVLDAFEIIFVIVPIVVPPLLLRAPDAVWVAVLVLLALQASFMLPPFGYALVMARTALKDTVPLRRLTRSLLPYLLAQLLVLVAVFAAPSLVHTFRDADRSRVVAPPPTDQQFNKRLEDMLPPPIDPDADAPLKKD